MEYEIVVNSSLAELLSSHGVQVHLDDEFVNTDLKHSAKFKARAVYREIDKHFSSRLDVMVVTDKGDMIIESFGDVGATPEDAINKNFHNLVIGSLHPILAALGCKDQETLEQVTIEEWVFNNKRWKAYIGSIVPKVLGTTGIEPPAEFFQCVEKEIRSRSLTNKLHWFRSFYSQWEGKIIEREFLVDNEPKDAASIFSTIPITPGVRFLSCRNFIMLDEVKKEYH